MLSSVLLQDGIDRAVEDLLRSEAPLRLDPENRIVFCGVSWKRYLAFDKTLGDDRPGPRLFYLDGELEIVTTSIEHERIRKWIVGPLSDYFEHLGTEIFFRGQATMRLPLKEAAAEPDESWCIGEEKKFPDLVLEIALTTGGINKLEIYRRFKVPEVWFYRRNELEMFALSASGRYSKVPRSKLLRGLDISLVERCLRIQSWQQARQTFRAGLAKSRRS
jgi:Uncharacterized protein conserved in cyanobacteria